MLIKGPNDALLTQGFPWLFGGGALLGSGALGDWEVWLALRQIAAPITSSREDLMPSIHPEARTTPTVRVEIARSHNPTGVLAKRFGVSTETIGKWRKRGAEDCPDHTAGRTSCPGKPRTRSGRSSVLYARPPAFRWMTSRLWSRTSCRDENLARKKGRG
jgi:hypothetical protein